MRNRPDLRTRGVYLPPAAARSASYRRRRSVGLLLLALLAAALVLVLVAASSRTDTHGARVVRYAIDSPLVHRTLDQVAVIAPGDLAVKRPLLVLLQGSRASSNPDSELFSALARLGPRAPDVVFSYGDEGRPGGAWGSYAMHEAIPQALANTHADPRRIAIAGPSTGAEELARLHPSSFCAVGAGSAVLRRDGWSSYLGFYARALASCHRNASAR